MNWVVNYQKHAGRTAEVRRRIELGAALGAPGSMLATAVLPVALDGARALLWLVGGIGRSVSTAFIESLQREFGNDAVLAGAVELCREQPPGPKPWLRQACADHAKNTLTFNSQTSLVKEN